MQITCVGALQPAPMVFWLEAHASHLRGSTKACPQGVLSEKHLQNTCLVPLQPVAKVFWAKSACTPHMWPHYSLFTRFVAKSARTPPVWEHYSLPSRCFGLKGLAYHQCGCATARLRGDLAKSECKSPVWFHHSMFLR